MRILHVNKFLYRRGGAEGYMLDLADLQRQQGHQVEFFGMRHVADDRPARFVQHFPAQVDLEPAPDRAADRLRAAARMMWSSSSRRGMAAVVEDFRPDVVHCHNIYHQLSPSVLSPLRRAGVPCVRCKDDSLSASTLLALESTVHRWLRAYDAVDVFLSPSRFLAGVVRKAGVYPDRVQVVNHFADVATTPTKDRAGGNLVFAGRLSREKGVDVLIEALALMRRPTALDVAGDGPVRRELEELAGTRAPGRVTFHGRLAKPQLQQLVRSSIASVVPSRWHENQPMTVLESFGAGVPVVSTDLGGLPELVRDGTDGLLVPAEQPAALAAALDALVLDPDHALAMGAAARTRVLADFSTTRHLRAVEAAYERAAARHRHVVGAGWPA